MGRYHPSYCNHGVMFDGGDFFDGPFEREEAS
jgi:hypothetical protein